LDDFDAEKDLYSTLPGFYKYLTGRPIGSSDLHTESILLYIDLYERDIIQEDDIIRFVYWLKYLGLPSDFKI